jgi:predicted house-cleaning noncanonical NTP pyrophosphatase (MazG superfamily)
MKKGYSIRNLEQDILNVWGDNKTTTTRRNRYTAFLLQKQIDEIREKNFSSEVMDKELADMVLIILQHYSCQNKSSEEYILSRLEKRHNGQTEQIKQKYHKLYRNYKFPEYISS